ncbi:MAG: D-glycero-beta-D-manno-heptose 1-phosphate adenylyltransferase [Verrucomicrobia bacterium]|nr:D-glycero-beta-D-manno-heptose 1-phosphate adenylyltransferase [Verrucomicrobiota bacterium]
MNKVIDRSQAPGLAKENTGRKVVFTNGCFDILHVGHVRYLTNAKALGDLLVVGLNSDESVRALKGLGRPINSEQDRAEVLAALEVVDHVIVFGEERASALIKELRPDIYVKGGDYSLDSLNKEELDVLKSIGARIKLLPIVPGKSTTSLIRTLQRR